MSAGTAGTSARATSVVLAGGTGGLGAVAARMLSRDYRVIVSYRANEARARTLSDIATVVRAAGYLYGLVVFAGDPVRGQSHDANYLGPVLLAREAAERDRAGVHDAGGVGVPPARRRTRRRRPRSSTPLAFSRRSAGAGRISGST